MSTTVKFLTSGVPSAAGCEHFHDIATQGGMMAAPNDPASIWQNPGEQQSDPLQGKGVSDDTLREAASSITFDQMKVDTDFEQAHAIQDSMSIVFD